jgi:hypothetical protein
MYTGTNLTVAPGFNYIFFFEVVCHKEDATLVAVKNLGKNTWAPKVLKCTFTKKQGSICIHDIHLHVVNIGLQLFADTMKF